MQKFNIGVRYTCTFDKELTIHAKDIQDAEERVTDLVSNWPNVEDVEILSIGEEF